MGEIVLVVIGILIAISINNWNNSLNDAAKETKILLQLKEGLTEDRNKMQAQLKNVVQIQKTIKKLDQLLENPDYKYSSELNLLFGPVCGMHIIKLNKAFYEIQLIRN
jgi:type II secretory pathway pseudopilin PulG